MESPSRKIGSGWTRCTARTRRRRSTPATRAKRRRRRVKTSSRLVEQPASLTAPPALRCVRVRLLLREAVKPGPARRPLLQLASCLHRPTRPSRLCLLSFVSCLVTLEQCFWLSLRSSIHWVYSNVILLPAFRRLYVYKLCNRSFLVLLLFVLLLFPLPPSLGCRLPSPTVALQSVAGGVLGQLGGSTLASLD